MTKEMKRTEIRELGEFGLIDRIRQSSTTYKKSTVTGIGDDAAVIGEGEEVQIVTTDMLTEGIHFDLSYMPLHHLGYKAVAINISDIAAMNGIPEQIVVSLGLSNRMSVEAVDALYQGINAACENYKVDLVGGDTTSSYSGLILSITAIGRANKELVTLRSTAKENDIVCVTGDLGGALVGLQVLEREKQVFLSNPEMQPELKGFEYIVGRQLKPEARMDIIHELRELGLVPSAMMDISDGLSSELHHICSQSGVGVNIYEDKFPIDKSTYDTAVEFKLDPITCVLNGGEDYELLFTISQDKYEKIKKHPDIATIGYITNKENGMNLVTKSGNAIPLKAQGWNHFDQN